MKMKLTIERFIAVIDQRIHDQVSLTQANKQFEQLYSVWAGLHSLLQYSDEKMQEPLIQFKLLNISLDEISKPILEQILSQQSFHQPGCHPVSIILGDYYFTEKNTPLLSDIACITSAVFSPFITAQYNRTDTLPESEFIKIISPKVVVGKSLQTRINGIYLYAKQIIHSFNKTHWFYDINTLKIKQHHYPVSELPNNQYTLQKHRYKDLYGTTEDPFYKFEHVLAVSRITHYIKILLRNKIGSYHTNEQCQEILQNWLHQYCATQDKNIRYPLLRASIKINEHCTLNITPYFNQYSHNKTVRFKVDK